MGIFGAYPYFLCASISDGLFFATVRPRAAHQSVPHIFFMSSLSEMVWVHARAVIAGMQNIKSDINLFFKIYFKRHSVRPNSFSINRNLPITIFTFTAKPLPAITRTTHIHLLPEALFKSFLCHAYSPSSACHCMHTASLGSHQTLSLHARLSLETCPGMP